MSRTYDSNKQISFDGSGMDEFNQVLNDFIKKIAGDNDVYEILKVGADAFVQDALKLPKPYSNIRASGYTHLVKTFSNKINRARKEVEVGWGKYYGPMVEHGTVKMRSREHLKPLYERNSDKYAKLMMMKLYN